MKIINWVKENSWLTLILVLAAILRLYHLNFQSVWLDEIHTINEANPSLTWGEMYNSLLTAEPHPPLYFSLMRILFSIFGYSTEVLRLFSAIIGIVSLYAIYILGKEMVNKKVGLIAAFLLSINYFHLYYSQEGRPYIFLVLFTILAFYRLVLFLKMPTRRNAIYYGLFATLMIYGHFFGLFALLSQYLILLFFLVLTEKESRLKFFRNIFLSGIISVILFIPALPLLNKANNIKEFWIHAPTPDVYTIIFKGFFGNSELLLTLVWVAFILYFLRLSKEKEVVIKHHALIENKNVFNFIVFASWIVVVIMIPLLKSYLSVPMIIDRYFIVILPPIVLLIAIGISQISSSVIRMVFLSLFFIFSMTDIVVVKKYYKTPVKTQFREATQFIIDNNANHDPVVTSLSWYYPFFLNNEKVKTTIVDKPLQDYVNEMMQDSTKRKPFWYIDAHTRPYTINEAGQKFLDENFIIENNIDLYDTWTKHYVRTSGAIETADISKYHPLKDKNGDLFNTIVEVFEPTAEAVNLSGWAYFDGQDAIDTDIKVVVISNGKAFKVQTQKIKRDDVTSYFKSSFDLGNSGFASKIILNKLPKGQYHIGIILKNTKTNKEGLIVTDKVFTN